MPDLKDGESIEMQGSAKTPYLIKNTGGVYSCTCPAWRNQSLGIEQRTCKHIRKLRGEAAEKERVGQALPAARTSKTKSEGPPILLAHRWENDIDLADWWMSEKLDGVRAYWDGQKLLSRQGNEYHAPEWFIAGLPETPLDGELWLDRKAFQRTVSIVRRQDRGEQWKQIRYVVFDAPALRDPFESRLEFVGECVTEIGSEFIQLHAHERCRDLEHLRTELTRVETLGGEGLMLRQPGSLYEVGRSVTLLKVKTFHDDDAVVVDHVAGKGRHKGRMGALLARLSDGTEFSVGTGFSDKQREQPPEIGSIITFRYQELSDRGVPRFPSFVRLRKDGTTSAASVTPNADQPTAGSVKQAKSAKSTGGRTGKSTSKVTRATTASKAKTPGQAEKTLKTTKTPKEGTSVCRYFEFVDGKSSKFWEITLNGIDVMVRYGRIGAKGQCKEKAFDDDVAAQSHAAKLIAEKTDKGYVEQERPEA